MKEMNKRVAELKAPLGYSVHQLCLMGTYITRSQHRNLFEGLFDTAAQPYIARLLIGIFICYNSGLLPTKKQALKFMNATHGKTSQRYIRLAEEKGLLTVAQSKADQRVDKLCPTESLLALVESELTRAIDEFRFAAEALLYHDGLPDTGAPFLNLTKSGRKLETGNPFINTPE